MKYFNEKGIYINPISISSLNQEGYREFAKEAQLLKEQGIVIQKKKKLNKIIKNHKTYQPIKPISKITDDFVKNKNADNRLYYFRFIFKNKKYYKLGITSQTLKERYGSNYKKIDKVLYDEKIDNAIKIEKDLKKRFSNEIFPLKYFNDGGHTEIFDSDILDLDI